MTIVFDTEVNKPITGIEEENKVEVGRGDINFNGSGVALQGFRMHYLSGSEHSFGEISAKFGNPSSIKEGNATVVKYSYKASMNNHDGYNVSGITLRSILIADLIQQTK